MNRIILSRDGADGKRITDPGQPAPVPPGQLTLAEPIIAYDYWLKKRAGRLMPRTADINPSEIKTILSHLTLIDVLHEEPRDYFYRLEGEVLRNALDIKRAGNRLSALEGQRAEGAKRGAVFLAEVCRTKSPLAWIGSLSGIDRGFYQVEIIYLPFSHNGHEVDRIIQCFGFVLASVSETRR